MLKYELIMYKKIKKFIEETRVELKKVTWPKYQQVVKTTIIIILIVVTFSVFIGIIDFLFSTFLALIQK